LGYDLYLIHSKKHNRSNLDTFIERGLSILKRQTHHTSKEFRMFIEAVIEDGVEKIAEFPKSKTQIKVKKCPQCCSIKDIHVVFESEFITWFWCDNCKNLYKKHIKLDVPPCERCGLKYWVRLDLETSLARWYKCELCNRVFKITKRFNQSNTKSIRAKLIKVNSEKICPSCGARSLQRKKQMKLS